MSIEIPGYITPIFSLEGLKTKGRLVDIVDGDTVYIVLPVFSTFFKFNCRIYGIDTPEKRGENKVLGFAATQFAYTFFTGKPGLDRKKLLLDLAENKVILDVECLGFDKYGRLLVNISYVGFSYANEIVRNNLAYSYTGGKKKSALASAPAPCGGTLRD
jgi:endonuclease YncB( thermonuclease family)